MSSRTYARNAYESNLNGAIGSGDVTISVDSTTGLTAPCYLVIDPEVPASREFIKVGGLNVNDLTTVTRGLAGSTSGAQAHADGAVVRMVPVHQTIDDTFDDIEALEAADAAHFGGTLTSDHPEATTSTRGFLSSSDKTKLDALATANQVTGGDLHDHAGGDGAQIAHSSLSGITPGSSNHVTGGDSHNHQGGDGGTINHSALSGLANDEHTQYLNVSRHDADDHSALVEREYIGEKGAITAPLNGTFRLYAPFNLTITGVTISAKAGTCTVDVNRNGTTIFATQANRPAIASGNFDRSGTPDGTVACTKDVDYITVDVDAASGLEDLNVCLEFVRS